jgi:hypothetical protein
MDTKEIGTPERLSIVSMETSSEESNVARIIVTSEL